MNRRRLHVALVILALFVGACGQGSRDPNVADPTGGTSASGKPSISTPSLIPETTMNAAAAVAWIAYQADDLRMVSPDGRESRPALPGGLTNARHPDWSPDGQRIAFVADEDDSRDIWIAGWDGSDARRVYDCEAPCFDADGPAWSPDGRSLVFRRYAQVDGACPGSTLDVLDLATGAVKTVASTQMPEYIGAARWSNAGGSIVMNVDTYPPPVTCDSSVRSRSDVAVLDLADPTQTLRRITDLETFPSLPDWHPTEDLILFSAGPNDPSDLEAPPNDLFTVRPDGTGLTRLTQFGPDDPVVWIPAWSPDGRSILVTVSPRDGSGNTLGSLNADGTDLRQLPGPVGGAHPRQRPTPAP
jgi:Tol biopolymer transport system component